MNEFPIDRHYEGMWTNRVTYQAREGSRINEAFFESFDDMMTWWNGFINKPILLAMYGWA